ncbi:MAG TPA: RCC1 domain-containing protein [Archangium sp.]|nr:RCC1 domain-containing protein [Archangium sp.]
MGKLAAGANRTFTAEAFNSNGTKLYAGAATGVTILAKQTTAVSITLQEVKPPSPFQNAAPVINSRVSAASAPIGGGWNHTVVQRQDGTLWARGYNHNGQLGDGTTTSRSSPVLVPAF